MPSFDDLKKNLSDESPEKSGNTVVKVSKKDKTLIQVEADSLEQAYFGAINYFHTDKKNLSVKIQQKGSKGVLGVGKKKWKVLFKFHGDSFTMHEKVRRDGVLRIHIRNSGVFIKVIQGSNGGTEITEEYANKSLVERKVKEYDKNKVREAINENTEKWVKVSEPIRSNPDWNSRAKIESSKDEMSVTLIMTPPILNGKIVEKAAILQLLESYNVTYGIKEDRIDSSIDECIYNKPIIIAEGKKPIDGKDAYIDFKFKINPETDIELKEDQFGKIDYFNLIGLIQNVVEDQVLAVKVDATKGQAGMTTIGKVIEAKDGEDIQLPAGKNTKISDNGYEIISLTQGQAIYDNSLISVEPVYTVNGNVDLSTGKIVFLGTVIVKGDVEDGFGVKATQNVEIGGTVGRCEIEAEGNIIIKGGIQGKSTLGMHGSTGHATNVNHEEEDKEPEGFVKAGKNVFVKFINGSIVKAENDIIVSDAIYHSKVTAGNRIICLGKKGRIVGGKLVAAKEINAKEIGSRTSYTLTEIEVGTDPEAKEKLLSFEYELREKEEQIKKMNQNIEQLEKHRTQNKSLPHDKEILLQKFRLAIDEHRSVVDEIKEDVADLRSYLEDIKTNGKISVKEYIYPGVHIQIKEIQKKIERDNTYVTYLLEGGEIRDVQYQDVDKLMREQIKSKEDKKNEKKKK